MERTTSFFHIKCMEERDFFLLCGRLDFFFNYEWRRKRVYLLCVAESEWFFNYELCGGATDFFFMLGEDGVFF